MAERKCRLTVLLILTWADAYHRRTGRWPKAGPGPVADAPGEHWRAVDSALRHGGRGLAPGSSLARLLGERRGVPGWRGKRWVAG